MERGLFYKFRIVIYIFLVAVMAGVIFCIYPANTQIREVIVAYYHFVENKQNVPLKTETDSNREQETNKNMCLVILDKFRNAVKKMFE